MTLTKTIGELAPVSIRDVWPDEARDLTPWLAENPEALGRALGMDLELDGSEVAVGPFSADLLLRDANTGKHVVVENMIGNTDHDHLGKIITYAAGLGASHAVLIAETFRQEHRSALQWLNANSRDSVSFFGIALKVWKIGDSVPAPQLDVVVEPDEWVRSVHAASLDELSGTQVAYRDFWAEFLPAFHERYPGWSRARTPSKDNWMHFPSGTASFHYSVNFCRPDGRPRFRFELYVDGKDKDDAARRYSGLVDKRPEIEGMFDLPLEWEPLARSRSSRVACYYPDETDVHARGRWNDIRGWTLEHIGAFKQVMQPHLNALS